MIHMFTKLRKMFCRPVLTGVSVRPTAMLLLLLLSGRQARAALLLDEDFSCAQIGCNATHQITNYSYWRWSTTGSRQSYLTIGRAQRGRAGNEVNFSVEWCPPPVPNPQHLGCYRSELALQRRMQGTLFDWQRINGTVSGWAGSERWFGFSNRLLNFSWVTSSSGSSNGLNGPSFQLHGGTKWEGSGHSGHPVLNLQVDSTGCAQGNHSCPVWTVGVSAGGSPNPACSEGYDACWTLGPALLPGKRYGLSSWQDWVIQWRASSVPGLGCGLHAWFPLSAIHFLLVNVISPILLSCGADHRGRSADLA